MRILFVTSTPFLMEPLGAMMLMALCKKEGHETRLVVLGRHRLGQVAKSFRPDVIAYSASTGDMGSFKKADEAVRRAFPPSSASVPFRVMGGPHPTFSPEVLHEMELDAICQGDGDDALPELLRRLETGQSVEGIANIQARGAAEPPRRALTQDLDRLPFPARAAFYEAIPYYRSSGLRSFITGRGCPYKCTYCFNHAFNRMFKECGPVLRRRSVDNVLEEIEQVRRDFPPLRLVRFADDTFAHQADDWTREFADKYPRRIGVPFYCLMRSNTLTEETARLLARAGCQAIGMSIESGSEVLRNEVLHRGLTDNQVRNSFALAEQFGIRTYASTMLGIPGGRIEDDFDSLDFVRRMGPTAPIFTICTPYHGTDIWRKCVERGYVDESAPDAGRIGEAGTLRCFTPQERAIQQRACYLGPLYCTSPKWLAPAVMAAIRGPFPRVLARYAGFTYTACSTAIKIFPQAIPRNPMGLLRIGLDSVRHLL